MDAGSGRKLGDSQVDETSSPDDIWADAVVATFHETIYVFGLNSRQPRWKRQSSLVAVQQSGHPWHHHRNENQPGGNQHGGKNSGVSIEADHRAARELAKRTNQVGRISGRRPWRKVLQKISGGRLGRRTGPAVPQQLDTPLAGYSLTAAHRLAPARCQPQR